MVYDDPGRSASNVLITSPSLHRPSRPTEVFASEVDARRRFHQLWLEIEAPPDWAQLMAVEGKHVRPLCWFGRPTALLDDQDAGRRRHNRRVTADSPANRGDPRGRNRTMQTTGLTSDRSAVRSSSPRTTRRAARLLLGAVLLAATTTGTIRVHDAIDHDKNGPRPTVSTVVSTPNGAEFVPLPGGQPSESSRIVASPGPDLVAPTPVADTAGSDNQVPQGGNGGD